MQDVLEKHDLHKIGRVTIEIKHILDPFNESDYLGEFSNYRSPVKASQKLVHRDTGAILDHHGIWRDVKGRIVATPEERRYSREHQYTWHDNGHECLEYAANDSRRLERLNDGDWCYMGIVATVLFDNKEIGEDSLWGVESDSGAEFIRETERDVSREALHDARKFRTAICKA